MSFSNAFASGFSVGNAIKERNRQEKDQEDIRNILNEKPVSSMVNNPTYQGMTGSLDEQDIPTQQAKVTTFQGKTIDGDLTDQQANTMRNSAVLDVIKRSDPIKAFQMERQFKADEQNDYRFNREKKQGEREDAFLADKENVFKNSRFGKMQSEYAKAQEEYQQQMKDYEAKKASGAADIGLPPSAPSKPRYEAGDRLSDMADMFDVEAKHGKLDMAKIQQYGDVLEKVRNEGYGQALKLAQGGASLQDVAKAFNATGEGKFDPANVVSDEIVKSKNAPPTRVIKYKDEQGNVRTINTLSELDSLDKADKVFSRYFQQKSDARADSAEGRANAAEGRAAESFNISKQERNEKRAAGVEYYKQKNPNATPEELAAVRAGIIDPSGATNKDAPSEVKLAQSMVNAGLAPDMKTALGMAINKKADSPDALFNTFVEQGIKNMSPPKDAVATANEAMQSMGYVQKNGRWTSAAQAAPAAPAAKPANESDAQAQAQAAIARGANKNAVNERLKSMGFKPLP